MVGRGRLAAVAALDPAAVGATGIGSGVRRGRVGEGTGARVQGKLIHVVRGGECPCWSIEEPAPASAPMRREPHGHQRAGERRGGLAVDDRDHRDRDPATEEPLRRPRNARCAQAAVAAAAVAAGVGHWDRLGHREGVGVARGRERQGDRVPRKFADGGRARLSRRHDRRGDDGTHRAGQSEHRRDSVIPHGQTLQHHRQ